jgi:hypothetical protein
MAQTSQTKCAHPACTCQVPEGKTYCSDYCQNHAHDKGKCGCGHPGCA